MKICPSYHLSWLFLAIMLWTNNPPSLLHGQLCIFSWMSLNMCLKWQEQLNAGPRWVLHDSGKILLAQNFSTAVRFFLISFILLKNSQRGWTKIWSAQPTLLVWEKSDCNEVTAGSSPLFMAKHWTQAISAWLTDIDSFFFKKRYPTDTRHTRLQRQFMR